jgi:glycosyltransferase involved in cell wall biosynthesis
MDFDQIAERRGRAADALFAVAAVKRIAFLTHEPFYPPSGGGSAEALYLVEEMAARGHQVHVFCPKLEDAAQVRERFKIHVHEFTLWKMGRYAALRNFKYLLYPTFLRRLVESVARESKFDLVFSQHAISAVAAGQLKRSLGAKVVMNFLDYLTAFMETWPPLVAPRPAVNALKSFEINLPRKYRADAVLTVSDTLADYFKATGYEAAKIHPIYFGFDAQLFPFRETAPPAEPIVVMHGSLDQHHLQEIAARAVALVSKELPSAKFRFVGHRTATLEKFLARAQTLAPSAKLEATGFMPYTEVAKHLSAATVGIVPYEESTGTHCAFVAKIVEYLAVGLPVVSTRLNSASRYFSNEPTVRFTDFEGGAFGRALLEALRALYDLAAARRASERVRGELDWRAISRRAVDFAERA